MNKNSRRQVIQTIQSQKPSASSRAMSSRQPIPVITQKEDITMANQPTPTRTAPTKPSAPPAKPATAAAKPATNGTGEKPKKAKRARVRLVSDTVSGFWVRAYKDIVDKFGLPLGPDGKPLVVRAFVAGPRLTPEEREAKKAQKAAEKAAFDAMPAEEKAAFAAKRREEKAAARSAKKEKEREAMKNELREELKREMAAGKA